MMLLAWQNLEFYFPIFYQFPNLLGLVVIVLYGNRFSFRQRIVPGILMWSISGVVNGCALLIQLSPLQVS